MVVALSAAGCVWTSEGGRNLFARVFSVPCGALAPPQEAAKNGSGNNSNK